jgi:flagellar hook-associated protein 2
MATITSAGLGSGLDISGIVTKLMEVEQRPLLAIEKRQADLKAELSAYGTIKGALSAFQSAMKDLNNIEKYKQKKVESSDASCLKVSANTSAVAGSYNIEIKQLAQSHRLASAAFATDKDVVGTGSLTLQFGSFNGTEFVSNDTKPPQTLTIDGAQSSLTGIRDAINQANIGVAASILNDGSGYRLVLKSNDTGAENSLKITINGDGDGNNLDNVGLSRLAFDPAVPVGQVNNGRNLEETVAAKNAILNVDGIDNIHKSSNVVTDVIEGVSLNLARQSALGTTIAVTVGADGDKIKEAIEGFVKAYNDVNKVVKDLTAYDPVSKRASVLQGDYFATSIKSGLARTLNKTIEGLSGAYGYLSQIGVTVQRDGTLAVDAAKLDKAIAGNVNDIATLFAAVGRTSDSLAPFAGSTAKTLPGVYDLAVTQLPGRAQVLGNQSTALESSAGIFSNALTIDGTNNTLSLVVDGIASNSITLANGQYTSVNALLSEIQTKINGDSALNAAGKSVSVTFDSTNSKLAITSNAYGSSSGVQIVSVTGTTLGLVNGMTASGKDALGSLGGQAAVSLGNYLLGAPGSAAEGLKVRIDGGALGARGTVSFSHGYAYELAQAAQVFLDDVGPVETRSNGLRDSLKDLDKRKEALNRRLEAVEKRLMAQFIAMDAIVGQMRATSDYLSRQLTAVR